MKRYHVIIGGEVIAILAAHNLEEATRIAGEVYRGDTVRVEEVGLGVTD